MCGMNGSTMIAADIFYLTRQRLKQELCRLSAMLHSAKSSAPAIIVKTGGKRRRWKSKIS
jgi:hypothetical protein